MLFLMGKQIWISRTNIATNNLNNTILKNYKRKEIDFDNDFFFNIFFSEYLFVAGNNGVLIGRLFYQLPFKM